MSKQQITAPKFTLVTAGLLALSNTYPSRPYQASRAGAASNLDVIGATIKVSEDGQRSVTLKQETVDLYGNLLVNAWDRPEVAITVPLTNPKKDAADLRKQRVADLKEFKTIEMFSGTEGTFPFQGKDVKITHDDMISEWVRTFPEKVKVKVGRKTVEMCRFESPEFEAALSCNRALTLAVLIHNTVARKADALDAIITHIPRECRDYKTSDNRDDASIYLNEINKLGRLAPSKRQRLGAAISKVERGAIESDLRTIFAAGKKQRGDIQVHFKVPATLRFLKYLAPKTKQDPAQTVTVSGKELTGLEAYEEIKGWCLDGKVNRPTAQGLNLKSLNAMFNIATHVDGLTEAFAKEGPEKGRPAFGVRKGKTLNAVLTQSRIRANPVLAQMVVDYFTNRCDKDWKDPRWADGTAPPTSSMANAVIVTACAEIEEGPVRDLAMTCAGEDTGHDLIDILKEVAELVEKVRLLDPETGEELSDHLVPSDMLDISSRLSPKSKALKKALKAAG